MLNDVEIGAAIAGIGFTNDNRPANGQVFIACVINAVRSRWLWLTMVS